MGALVKGAVVHSTCGIPFVSNVPGATINIVALLAHCGVYHVWIQFGMLAPPDTIREIYTTVISMLAHSQRCGYTQEVLCMVIQHICYKNQQNAHLFTLF